MRPTKRRSGDINLAMGSHRHPLAHSPFYHLTPRSTPSPPTIRHPVAIQKANNAPVTPLELRWYGRWVVWCALWCGASGHGRLVEPPSRASAWRYGFDTPHNYNDHELYCGGFARQWHKNDGKCGVCGDAWDQPAPRPHELGGRFGKGVIVRRYASGDALALKVELTANHNGYFEFRVCEEPRATQDCLDRHLLRLDGRDAARYYPRDGNRVYEMRYRLPAGLSCAHCLLQWRYIAGNNWGTCDNGTGAVGCGPQEEFRACADIAIGDAFATSSTTRRPRPTYVPPARRPTAPPIEDTNSGAWYAVLVAAVALLLTLVVLAVIYLYYYRGGMKIKNLLKTKAPPSAPAPVPPPRQKRASPVDRLVPQKVTILPDCGFETVDLNVK
ncbi:hypothetical protein EVAR_103364_1 [Eumeta japonica]|uniref:Chitin-binding type-4 domain-containing protein n=1 Tax=Eumeta variegata TaxID=151549 RepID=A0A4C1YA17_EUMVA|nr:hypothetical protein EVAR_103364_1 [Eumeta japonica]